MKKLFCLNQEKNMQRPSTVCKQKQSKTVLNRYVGGYWYKRTTWEGKGVDMLLWTIDWQFGKKRQFKVKTPLMMNWIITNTQWIDGLETCGLLVDYCDVFISCLDSHSDGTHSLQTQQAPDVYVTSGWCWTWRRTDVAFWLKMKIGLTSIWRWINVGFWLHNLKTTKSQRQLTSVLDINLTRWIYIEFWSPDVATKI